MKRFSLMILANIIFLSSHAYAVTPLTCAATYANKPFYQVVIYGRVHSLYSGPAECYYGFPGSKDYSYYWLPGRDYGYYHPLNDNWTSVTQGTSWCGVPNGHYYDQCVFAKG